MLRSQNARLKAVSVLLVGGLALGACAAGTPEAAVQDRSAAKLLTGESFLTGLGLQSPNAGQENIDNRPRGALVIPPSRDLPSPEESKSASTQSAEWPNDVDIALANRRRGLSNGAVDDRAPDEPLSATEIRQGTGGPVAQRRQTPRVTTETEKEGGFVSAAQLRREAAIAREIRARRAETTTRERSLIAPPPDLTQAPEGAVVTEEKKKRRWWPFGR